MKILHFSWAFLLLAFSCQPPEDVISGKLDSSGVVLRSTALEIRFDSLLNTNISILKSGERVTLTHAAPAFVITTGEGEIATFSLERQAFLSEDITSPEFGQGKKFTVVGKNRVSLFELTLSIELYEKYPNAIISQASFRNRGPGSFVRDFVINRFHLDASLSDPESEPGDLWTFQGIAREWGADYVFPLSSGFRQENFAGFQKESRLGGGVPLIDVWSRKMGLAIASLETKPTSLSFPTEVLDDGIAVIGIKAHFGKIINPTEKFRTPKTIIIAHSLDFYEPLTVFSSVMKDQGVYMKEPSPETYEIFWCGWGYGTNFTPEDIYNVIPKLKELGIKWIVIDDGWFDRYGDWNPRKEVFPGGEKQLKEFVDSLHAQGFLVKIWWVPTLVQPDAPPPGGKWPPTTPGPSSVFVNHPEWVVKHEDGTYARCPRNMCFLNGGLPDVQLYIKELTRKFIEDWGFDGHKLDAYWVVPPSYDSLTPDPNTAFESVPELIETIYETSKQLKPYSVTEICNCGVPQDYFQSIYTDQPVVSDPTSYAQVRHRVKQNKAQWGPDCPVYADHVEHVKVGPGKLGTDFASAIGTGAVPGTKFTWPGGPEEVLLTPEKEIHWKKWLGLYNTYKLSSGEYINAYDIGFDLPEAHVIKKDGSFYYAFYGKNWNGEVELRGLDPGRYFVRDYVNNTDLGSVSGPTARIPVVFDEYLLLECKPAK